MNIRLLCVLLLVANAFGSPLVPRVDPVDGLSWRGDQFYSTLEAPPQDGVFAARDVRWGFEPDGAGRWAVHLGRARIDTRRARRVTLLMTPFDPRKFASHAALLFEFDAADAITDPATGRSSKGLVISAEARIREGQQFNLAWGLSGKAPLVLVVSTWEDYQQSLITVWQDKLERFVLRLDAQEARGALRTALERALTGDRTPRYNLLSASCATQAVDILNGGLPPARRIQRAWFGGYLLRPGVSIAGWLPAFLTRRGYVEERLPDLP